MNGKNHFYKKISKKDLGFIISISSLVLVLLVYVNIKIARIEKERYIPAPIVADNSTQYTANISSDVMELKMSPGAIGNIPITVENTSQIVWENSGENPVNLAYHILDSNNKTIDYEGMRTPFSSPVDIGEKRTVNSVVKVPDKAGTYILEFDLVQEYMTWFSSQGAKTLKINLKVE